jgi:predicted ATP-grasp superfamily ATP-dependent carboligase
MKLRYCGILDLDIRWDARDDQYKLLDFNPRLGAQFRLFRDTSDIDVILAQYLDLTGQAVPESEQVNGRYFVTENYDPIAAIAYWRCGELDLRSWLASMRKVDETAWFARDDLRPFGLMCLRMGWRLMSRPFARHGTQPADKEPSYLAGRARIKSAQIRSGPQRPQRELAGQLAGISDEKEEGAPV